MVDAPPTPPPNRLIRDSGGGSAAALLFVVVLALLCMALSGCNVWHPGGITIINEAAVHDAEVRLAVDETMRVAEYSINLDEYTLAVYDEEQAVREACDGNAVCLRGDGGVMVAWWPADDHPQGAAWVAWVIGLAKYGADVDTSTRPEWFDWQVRDSVVGLVYDAFGGERFYYDAGRGLL